MKYLFLLLLIGTPAYSREYRLLELDYLSFDTYKIEDYRDYNYPYSSNEWQAGNAINFNLCLICGRELGLYWDNIVRGNATEFQYREVSWKYALDISIGTKVDILWEHESRHIMDSALPENNHFPLSNRYVLRINFYVREKY